MSAVAVSAEKITLGDGITQEVFRTGSGPTLVWLHGIERFQRADSLVAELARRFTVIAPVVPGYADLADVVELRNVHDLALHYDSLLTELGLENVTLVGHSFGGMIAAELAAHVPQRVSRLVLISPLGLWNDSYPVDDVVARPYPEMLEQLWLGARSRPGPPGNDAASVEDRVEQMIAIANGLATVSKFTWPIPDKGLRRRLHRIVAPTLVIFGSDDAYVSARYADDFVAGIRGAIKHVVPGSHMLPYERPAEVAAELGAFIQGLGQGLGAIRAR